VIEDKDLYGVNRMHKMHSNTHCTFSGTVFYMYLIKLQMLMVITSCVHFETCHMISNDNGISCHSTSYLSQTDLNYLLQ
jgi:hypothetical protein